MTTTNNTYGIDDSNGNQITAGIQGLERARAAAQALANERGRAVALYPTPARLDADGEPIDESETVEPTHG